MKKAVTGVILVFCSLLLLSCGSGSQGTQSPIATGAEATTESVVASAPKMEIDDSLSFYAERDWESASPFAPVKEAFLSAYTERMGQYIENLEVAELRITPLQFDNSSYVGYFVLTGAPIEDLGWERAESCCRSFSLSTDDDKNWSFAKSYPMRQGDYLDYWLWENDYSSFREAVPVVGELSSAELYVSQLAESYTITDKEALEALAKSLSLEWDGDFDYTGTRLNKDCEFVNPLYLSFTDGSTKIALTAGDGSNACYIWDFWYPYNTSKSIFEQFGVPLPAAGYEHSGDMATTVNSFVYDSSYPNDQEKYKGSEARMYDPSGRLVELHKYWDSDMPMGGAVHDLVTLDYDGHGRLVKSENYSDDILYTTYIYEYDGQGQLTRRTTVFSGAVSGVKSGAGVIEEYKYDELSRVIEIKRYYPNDEGGPSTSSASFWYDDEGCRHGYQ